MFRPHKGICGCHGKERWILNKKGECNEGIRQRKNNSNRGQTTQGGRLDKTFSYRRTVGIKRKNLPQGRRGVSVGETICPASTSRLVAKKPIKKKPITKKAKKATGEAELFKGIWEKACNKKGTPKCQVCSTPLGIEPRSYFFSHVLAKATYGLFRLWKINIWLCCFDCHQTWDQGDRSQPKFAAKRFFAEKLKQLYYEIKDLPEEDQKEEMQIFEYEND